MGQPDAMSRRVGKLCRLFRQNRLRMTQREFGYLCGYTESSIGAFENGRTRNYRILLEYMGQGLLDYVTVDELCGYVPGRWS